MRPLYEPYIMRRLADGRLFYVNGKMPFELFHDCFQHEQPFFLISQLQDRRIAIIPNATAVPRFTLQAGFGPQDLLPADCEYVTLKDGTYPVIITAHPVANIEDWMIRFEKWVNAFAKQPLEQFVASSFAVTPIAQESAAFVKMNPTREPVTS